MLHFEPPPRRTSVDAPRARPPLAPQSQYLFTAELDAPRAGAFSMPRSSPASPSAPDTSPTAAGPSRVRPREEALGEGAGGDSSESSLDPDERAVPRRRASSLGPRPHGETSGHAQAQTALPLLVPNPQRPTVAAEPLDSSGAKLGRKRSMTQAAAPVVSPATDTSSRPAVPGPSSPKPAEAFSYAATSPAIPEVRNVAESPSLSDPATLRDPFPDVAVFERKGPTPAVATPSHLPPLVKGLTGLTAYANWDVANDVEWSLAKVVGPAALHEVMKDPEAFQSLRDFVASTGDQSAPHLLDLYRDLVAFSHVCTTLRLSSSCISSTYLLKTSPARLALPISLRGPVLECLYESASIGHPLLEPLQVLHVEVFTRFFQPFVQQKLVEQVVARLASWKAGLGWTGKGGAQGGGTVPHLSMAATDGLAECYCLSDPALSDNPITLASPGFVDLTGYPLKFVIGRNCRFLQGPGTSPESVKRLHDALAHGRNVTSLIFNYRANGSAFANLLCMAPLKDEKGVVRHFIGGQIDVTGALNALVRSPSLATQPLRWLHAGVSARPAPSSAAPAPTFTPFLQAQISRLTAVSRQTGVSSGEAVRELGATSVLSGASPEGPSVGRSAQATPMEQKRTEPTARQCDKAGGSGSGKTPFGWLGTGGKARSSPSTPSRLGRSSLESSADDTLREGASSGTEQERTSQGQGRSGAAKEKKGRGVEGTSGTGTGSGSDTRVGQRKETDSTAESLMHEGLRAFEQTYSRVALVDRATGNILYTTPELVEHCGLPASSHHDLQSTSFVKILSAPSSSSSRSGADHGSNGERNSPTADSATTEEDRDQTYRLRRNVRLAVENGHGWTGLVGLQPVVKKLFARKKCQEPAMRDSVLHLTPLCNREGRVEALVAVFG